jgi:hypothetical protein
MSDVRASDAERDQAVARLRDAAAEGRVTFEELADRIEAASQSATRSELETLTADLPAAVSPAPVTSTAVQQSVFGDVRRSGSWSVPERSQWRSVFGDVVLDLREARVGAGLVTLDARSFFGDVDVLVPEGVVVELRSRTVFGSMRQESGEIGPPGAPRVIVEGGSVFGDVKVRTKRLREKLAQRFLGG